MSTSSPPCEPGLISYILKDVKMEDLVQAIGRTARGEATLHPRVASRLVFEMHGAPKAKVNPFTELTERELEVLKLIAGGLTNSKIAEQLIISQNTVKGHVSNILSELHLAGRTEAAVYAWKEGIVRRENVD